MYNGPICPQPASAARTAENTAVVSVRCMGDPVSGFMPGAYAVYYPAGELSDFSFGRL